MIPLMNKIKRHHYTKSLSPPHIIEVHVPWQRSERPCVCVLVESMLHVSTMISLLIVGTVLTVWYFSFYFNTHIHALMTNLMNSSQLLLAAQKKIEHNSRLLVKINK
jgi:hypothetical protein